MIVGIMGFAHSGKNTVAEILRLRGLERNKPFVEMAFADELKRIVMNLFDFTEEQCWGILKEQPDHRYPREHSSRGALECERNDDGVALCSCCRLPRDRWEGNQCYLTPRYAQQLVGTEGARACYPNIWAEKGMEAARLLSRGSYRYHRAHGLTIDVGVAPMNAVFSDNRFINEFEAIKDAGGKVFRIKRKGYEKPAHDHPSEVEQLQIPDDRLDGVINNDEDLDHLEREVVRAVFGS